MDETAVKIDAITVDELVDHLTEDELVALTRFGFSFDFRARLEAPAPSVVGEPLGRSRKFVLRNGELAEVFELAAHPGRGGFIEALTVTDGVAVFHVHFGEIFPGTL